ncbi:MAG: tRNA (adenosine(37)-N6)-dimethylallyltransferase MiaA [Bacteroidia bacterium]|nr:tRNA (adenosine(37)-N6)-dimethylallyltransferase MiaA [Sphingobacteriaceae bacterium]MBK7311717.1 tRNA (adenosine(37)-N6)-dimethylallyltransferase MiaA [Sphingobacteriaceae bacterium]MBP9069528.1 tRNA (adenosine(37)-N6)-dimethylallyltransferase MiaA [Bacteroidia bacterium]
MNSQTKYLVVIAGPTAVGKTKLGIELAKHYNSVILSADSRQFYKELTIGTAKPSESELQEVKHYFINNKNITELFGAGHFEKEAIPLLDQLFKEHQLVFVVGGSGLYIDALLYGVDEFEDVPIEVREKLNAEFEEKGIEPLQNELKEKDPVYAAKVDLSNSQRVIRALEVCRHSKKPYSSFLKKNTTERNFTPLKIFINTDREKLYERINLRVDEMMKQGLLNEVKSLTEYKNVNALKTVGYKELFDHLEGLFTLEEATTKIKQHTRNYAKRQITWFKNQDEWESFEPNDLEKIKAYLDIIISI